jgi:hypothetical protein
LVVSGVANILLLILKEVFSKCGDSVTPWSESASCRKLLLVAISNLFSMQCINNSVFSV